MAAASSEKASLVFFMGSPRVLAFRGRLSYLRPSSEIDRSAAGLRLLLRQDPLHQSLDVGIGHLGPDPLAAFLDLVDELRFGTWIAAVFRRHFLVGRPDELLVRGMAGEAVVLLREFLLRIRGQRRGRRQGEEQYSLFHGVSLHTAFNCMRSLMGARHITPRHSHPLTGCERRGLSSGAGSRAASSGSASTTPSGRYSRANSSRQRSSSGPRPRSTRSFGGTSCSASAMAMAANPAG